MTTATIIRRPYLGRKSVRGIKTYMENEVTTVLNNAPLPESDVYFRWGCSSALPGDPKVINWASAMHRVCDKKRFRRILNDNQLCPETWFSFDDWNFNADMDVWPLVIRPATHSQGKNFWLCDSYAPFLEKCYNLGNGDLQQGNYYISEYIEKAKEFRVLVAHGKVVWVCEKIPTDPTAHVWNHHNGGSVFKNVRWSKWDLEVCSAAINAWQLSGLHFGGVDVIVDKDNTPYVLEINSAPSCPQSYRQKCIAKVFDWILNEQMFRILVFPENPIRSWKDIIHPAIWSPNQ